jgi:uncharacterized phage protein gp47/JayE
MPLFGKTEQDLYSQILIDIVDNTNLTRASPGSKVRAISSALSRQLGDAYKKFDANVAQAFVDGAVGKYLEFIGELVNVPKLGAQTSNASFADKSLRFYVDTGTFGTINGGSSITITSGTKISTGPDGTGIIYTIPYNQILSSSDSETFVTAQASSSGSINNVGKKQLNYHDFTNYTDSTNNTLKVTNEAEIVKGQDIEPEANYRYRIVNKVLTGEAANLTAVRIAALQVPGVADLLPLQYYRGIGSFELLIKGTTPTISSGLISAVQETVDSVKGYGIKANVRGPQEIGLSLTGTLILRKKLTVSEQNTLIRAVTENLTNYINSLDIGEDFIQNEAIERVMATSADIKNIGIANAPFDSKFIYKPSKLSDNKVRNTLIGDYTPPVDGRVIVELSYAGDKPILITIKS